MAKADAVEDFEVRVAPDKAFWGPPGTGKTTALMDELEAELKSGLRPTDIGGFTYRKRMAEEFADRASDHGAVGDDHWYRTTHSACFRLLDLHTDDVVDADDVRDFCSIHGYTFHYHDISNDPDEDDDSPWATTLSGGEAAEGEVLLNVRSYCINTGAGTGRWRSAPITREEREMLSDKLVADFNNEYEAWKEANGLVDFDDMLLGVVDRELAPPIDVLMEDEFQDKTPLQVAVYNVWASAANRVYVAGDPHQAIYRHQGTDPRFMEDAFEMADDQVVLSTSWRLGPDVEHVARRTLRDYYDVPEIEPTGEASVEHIAWDRYQSAASAHETDDTFHLARANFHLRNVAGVLSDAGVPFISETSRWTDRQRDLYNGVAEMVRAIEESPALTQPTFGLSDDELSTVASALPASALHGTKSAVDDAIDAGAAVADIVKIGELGTVLSGNPFDGIESRSSTTLVKSAIGSDGVRNRLRRAFDARDGEPIDDISHEMSTIHGAKGREADVVFLLDASARAIDRFSDPADEARVFYVGATRAIEKLYVVRCPWATYTTTALPDRL